MYENDDFDVLMIVVKVLKKNIIKFLFKLIMKTHPNNPPQKQQHFLKKTFLYCMYVCVCTCEVKSFHAISIQRCCEDVKMTKGNNKKNSYVATYSFYSANSG